MKLGRSVKSCLPSFGFLVGFINDKALEDGVHRYAVDRHEEHSYSKGNYEDEDKQVNGLTYIRLDRALEGYKSIETEGSTCSDHQLPQEHNNLPNPIHNSKSNRIRPSNFESILRSRTEALPSKSNLYIGLFIDKLNNPLDTCQTATKAIGNILHDLVIPSSCLSLLLEDLDHYLHKLDYCQDQGTES